MVAQGQYPISRQVLVVKNAFPLLHTVFVRQCEPMASFRVKFVTEAFLQENSCLLEEYFSRRIQTLQMARNCIRTPGETKWEDHYMHRRT